MLQCTRNFWLQAKRNAFKGSPGVTDAMNLGSGKKSEKADKAVDQQCPEAEAHQGCNTPSEKRNPAAGGEKVIAGASAGGAIDLRIPGFQIRVLSGPFLPHKPFRQVLGPPDRKSVVWGKSVSVSVHSGGRRIIKKKK